MLEPKADRLGVDRSAWIRPAGLRGAGNVAGDDSPPRQGGLTAASVARHECQRVVSPPCRGEGRDVCPSERCLFSGCPKPSRRSNSLRPNSASGGGDSPEWI